MLSLTHFFRAFSLAACAALSCGVGLADDDISLAFYEGWGHYKVEASFFVDADQKTAWDILTDYDHIPKFVNSMKVSAVQGRTVNDVVLQQEGEGGFLFFSKRIHLLLNVHEEPNRSIVFSDTSHKDFNFYEGSWQILKANSGHGLEVIYTLDAEQNFSAPAFIASDIVKGNVQDLLKSLRKQIGLTQYHRDQEAALALQQKVAKTMPGKLDLALKQGMAVDGLAVLPHPTPLGTPVQKN